MSTIPDNLSDVRLYNLDEVAEKSGLKKWRIQKACAGRNPQVAHHRVGRQVLMNATQIRELVRVFNRTFAPPPSPPQEPDPLGPDRARLAQHLRRVQRQQLPKAS